MMRFLAVGILAPLLGSAGDAGAETVTLVRGGQPACCVVLTEAARKAQPQAWWAEADAVYERWAGEDLATYLKKISGAEVGIGSSPTPGLVPIYVGSAAGQVALSTKTPFGDGYLIEVGTERVTLVGESGRATFYAAAQLLHELGVRWYAPGETGEVVPLRSTIELAASKVECAPDYWTRNLGGGEGDVGRWVLRNRLGGPMLGQGHAWDSYMGNGKYFKEHPEYYPIVGGKPLQAQANLSHPKVVEIFAEGIGNIFRGHPEISSASFCPDDGLLLDERPESLVLDGGRLDPLFKVPNMTESLVNFGNQIARRLEKEFPGRLLGFYVYANYNLPPARMAVHPMLVPIVAPIAFNRYSSIGNPASPTSLMLKENILGWSAKSPHLGFYLYNFNLADTAMPFTRRLAWSKDFPNLYAWGARYATIETLLNWHTMIPGNFVAARLLWNTRESPEAMLDEFYPGFYGPVAPFMREYNETLETAYETTSAYAGNLWSMHRILTPAVMKKLDESLKKAEKKARDFSLIARRVEIARRSLEFARLWFAAREALNRFRFLEAEAGGRDFIEHYRASNARFPFFYCGYIESYFKEFHLRSLEDAGRVARTGQVIYQFPDRWRAFLDDMKAGSRLGLYRPEVRTDSWIELRTYSASLDEQGFPFFRGEIWYRHDFELPRASAQAGALHLWLGGVDAIAHVYLNGEDLGSHPVANFGPLDLDITKAVRRAGRNVLVVAVDNTPINELGTGGLVRPAVIYAQ
ncbi:MAG: DUF4838 domain-containing protein [Planctomycetes bacterium]|nr:DUF4838 domain-containing protein [Planctomycetota bacterium]